MEGFVNTNASPFDNMKHSNNYANYGVDKSYIKREQTQQQNETKPIQQPNNQLLGQTKLGKNAITNIDKTVVDTVTIENKNDKQRMHAAMAVGGSVLVLGGLTFAITKGHIPKTITDSIGKFVDNLTKKADDIKKSSKVTIPDALKLKFIQNIRQGAMMARGALFNISPLKDVLFEKLIKNKCGLEKQCDSITNFFRGMSYSTVKSSYKKAAHNIFDMTQSFRNINGRIASGEITTTKPVSDTTLKLLEERTRNIHQTFNDSFAEHHLNNRNKSLIEKFNGLGGRVFKKIYGNMKGFVKDVNAWTTFVPEEIVANDKKQIINFLENRRKTITNNPNDNFKQISEVLKNLESAINPEDTASREVLKSLKDLAKQYSSLSGANEVVMRKKIVSDINSILKSAHTIIDSNTYKPNDSKKILSLIRQYGKIINTDKKGNIEEILTIYRDILPPEEYAKIKKIANKASNSLNRAVHNEGCEYLDKVRDLATGSALTDVAFGMGVPIATTGVALSIADSKEKKRSVALKYGIPLLVGMGVSTLGTVKLISGGKSLALGSISSIIANDLCERLDNTLKKRSQAKREKLNNDNTDRNEQDIKQA